MGDGNSDSPKTRKQGAEALKRAREAKFTEWFQDRRWRVMDEASGSRMVSNVPVVYDQGKFTIPPGAKFRTPLGHAGRTGFLVMELDAMGQDTGNIATFGLAALRQAQDAYGLIVGLPGGSD